MKAPTVQRRLKALNNASLLDASEELSRDPILGRLLEKYGPPPLWDRPPGFPTLLHIILEQQVSIASARACFDKLGVHLGGSITPDSVHALDDPQLRSMGFSRQKAAYARHLAGAIRDGHLDLDSLRRLSDDDVRKELTKIKGVGRWTSDIYLLMALLRPDVMPRGDIALHEAYRRLSDMGSRPSADEFLEAAERWTPFRSVAARMLWHFYLSERKSARAATSS